MGRPLVFPTDSLTGFLERGKIDNVIHPPVEMTGAHIRRPLGRPTIEPTAARIRGVVKRIKTPANALINKAPIFYRGGVIKAI